jgi:hypothetical protein
MRFLLGVLVGYCLRGKQRLLIATLTAIAVGCFIVLPAIALSLLALDVRRERLSRPPQTSVPALIGLDYKTAQIKARNANLSIVFWPSGVIYRLNPEQSSLRRLSTGSE